MVINNDSMNLFEEVVENACHSVHTTTMVDYQGTEINFGPPVETPLYD
jgi:lysyl-tRNA synthetase class II